MAEGMLFMIIISFACCRANYQSSICREQDNYCKKFRLLQISSLCVCVSVLFIDNYLQFFPFELANVNEV